MGKRIRTHNWTATPLGPVEVWPQSLKTVLATVLASPVPSLIAWGPQYVILYNDPYVALLGTLHPAVLGQPTATGLAGFWHELRPRYARVVAGETFTLEGLTATYPRAGRPETFSFTAHYSPLRDETQGVAGVLVQMLDTTERVRAEAGLREREARYRAVVDQATVGISQTDLTGRFLLVNDRYCEFVGRSRAELLSGLRLHDVTEPDDLPRNLHAFDRLLDDDVPFSLEKRYLRPDGTRIWAGLEVSLVRDAGGAPLYAQAIVRDITRRKQAERELADLNRDLEVKVRARTREVRELAAQLTLAEARERARLSQRLHDELQQQLYAVGFALQGLRPYVGGDAAGRAALDELRAFVKDAVAVTRAVTTDLSPPVLPGEGLAEALRWLGGEMAARHGLSVRVDAPDTVSVPNEAVRVLLFSLVRELLFNVAKHAGVDEATVVLSEHADRLELTVSDLGRGFDLAVLDEAGTGLGLAGMRRRLELFDGRLVLAAAPGEGTRVAIVVPKARLTLSRGAVRTLPDRSARGDG